ncbi:MAG: FkbM family methyltransferase [Terracidiphilus sp.]|jgi:FkbM family methyltransferase
MNRIERAIYKRLGLLHLGRRRVRDLLDFIEDRQIDVVIDVGANVGQFGKSLRECGYRGRIVSFEPIASAFQVLAKAAQADGNWEATQCGLGAASGTARLKVSELSVFSSILDSTSAGTQHDKRMAVDHIEEISIRTLDEIAAPIRGKILLKVDTQGYERQVMEGGQQTLPRLSGILLELPIIHTYEGVWQFHEAVKFMDDAGFVPAQITPVGYHTVDKVSAVEFDCLFRPRSQVDVAP